MSTVLVTCEVLWLPQAYVLLLYESLIAQWIELATGNCNVVGPINVTGSSCTLISISVVLVNLHFHKLFYLNPFFPYRKHYVIPRRVVLKAENPLALSFRCDSFRQQPPDAPAIWGRHPSWWSVCEYLAYLSCAVEISNSGDSRSPVTHLSTWGGLHRSREEQSVSGVFATGECKLGRHSIRNWKCWLNVSNEFHHPCHPLL